MTDMLQTIIPKSDQLNFDDLAAGQTKTIKITKVSIASGEQIIAINYEGDNGRPYMPCKSMRRVLVNCWGSDGTQYAGRSMTLYGDSKVKFGGMEVGGIRISHLSHISEPRTMALTATKTSRKPFTVHPLVDGKPNLDDMLADIATVPTLDGLKFKHGVAYKAHTDKDSRAKIDAAKDKRKDELTSSQGSPQ